MQIWWVSSLVLGLVSCGEADSKEPSVNGGGSAGANSTSGGSSAGTNAGTGGGLSAPVLCGGGYPRECVTDDVCVFDTGCGTVGQGTRKNPAGDKSLVPVCGCDGKTYSNACEARRAGVSPQRDGECDVPSQFSCGPYACAKGQYCFDKGRDTADLWRYACLALPEACAGTPSCECLANIKSCIVGSQCGTAGSSGCGMCQ